MARSSACLQDHKLLHCEFVVCNNDVLQTNEDIVVNEVEYVEETPTFYIQQGQYILPVDSSILLQHKIQEHLANNEDEEYVEVDASHSEQTIIYCTPEQFVEYSQTINNETNSETNSVVVDGAVGNDAVNDQLDRDSVQIIPLQDSPKLGDSNGSDTVTERNHYDDLPQQPNYQYAILRDGKLHLQTLNMEEDAKSHLKEQLAAFQASISLDDNPKNSDTMLSLNKITGKNLITGQTVMLDKYMNKLVSSSLQAISIKPKKNKLKIQNNVINKRVVVGKTSGRRKLIGKIVHVQKRDANNSKDNKIWDLLEHSNVIDKSECAEQFGNTSTAAITDTVSNILVGLMNLQSMCQKLYKKELVVKLVRKVYSADSGLFIKSVFLIKGHMETNVDKWCFLSTKVNECKNSKLERDSAYEDDGANSFALQEIPQTKCTNLVYLTVLIIVNKYGKTTTRVYLNPTPMSINRNVEIQLHNKLFGCEECFKTFRTESSLFHHKRVQHNQRWSCAVCDKAFNSVGSLKRHISVHDPSLRSLECSVCGLRFTDQSSLKKHLLIHTGIRAFVCEVCGRSFINRGDLTFHSRIHNPVKQFSCDVCGREFSRQSNLLRHGDIHRGASALFHCHICGCSYSFPSSLTRHIVHKHIGNFTEDNKT